MPSPAATKASDKQQAVKKLTALLQKDYGKSVPRLKLPVVETMLFATCLEDNSWENATVGYEKLLKSYFDLNEIRVSSVGEIEQTLSNLQQADWKGLRIRSILRFVFESTYSFDFEKLAKLTPESAQKRVKKIDFISPFIANFTMQQILGSHLICFDESSLRTAKHVGLVPVDFDVEAASEFLKTTIKKSDSFAFSCLLRCLATDPAIQERLKTDFEQHEFDVLKVAERLTVLKSPPQKKAAAGTGKGTAQAKAVPSKPAAVKAAATKPVVKGKAEASAPVPAAKSKSSGQPPKPVEKKAAAGKTAKAAPEKTPSKADRKKK